MKCHIAGLWLVVFATRCAFAQDFSEDPSNPFPALGYSAVAWGDIDNDGDWDCLITGSTNNSPLSGGVARVFRNEGDGSFVAVPTAIVGITAGSARWGDFDNDGDLDLLIGGWSAIGTVTRVYRNDGGFVFTDLNLGLPAVNAMQVDWGDYDNDGKRDILISGDGMTRVFHNDGSGHFSNSLFPLPGMTLNMQTWVDYDSDGDLDILLTAPAHGSDYATDLYRNDAGRKFTPVTSNVNPMSYGEVQIVDFDGDSDWDLAMVGTCCGGVPGASFYRNNAGVFAWAPLFANGAQAGSLAWGDYNNDGYADYCVTGLNALNQILAAVYRNDRGTNWTQLNDVFLGIIGGAVAWTDLDGDGRLDLHVVGITNFPSNMMSISRLYRNQTAAPPQTPSTPTNLVSNADLNNDVAFSWTPVRDVGGSEYYALWLGTTPGGMEVLAPEAILSSGRRLAPSLHGLVATNRWLIRDLPRGTYYWSVQSVNAAFRGSPFAGEGTFTITNSKPSISVIPNAQVAPEEATPPIPFAVSDLETPAASLAVSASATDSNLFPAGSFTFGGAGTSRSLTITPAPGLQGTATVSVVVADSVGATASTSFELRVEYFTSISLPASGPSWAVDIADFGNDGFLDLALGVSATLIKNPGISPFTNALTLNSGASELPAFAWGDYDNDGFMDLLMAGVPSRLFHNERNGNFSTNLLATLPAMSSPGAAWGDFNNDGRLDFVLCGRVPPNSSYSTRLYRNEGDGGFTEITTGLPGMAFGSVEWADFNGDALLDLVLCGQRVSGVGMTRVYRNNGDGTFTDTAAGLPNIIYGQARAADFNNDGHFDLLVTGSTGSSSGITKLYRNNGDGTFSDSGMAFPNLQLASARWGDFNNDGWLDLVLAGRTNPSSAVTKVFANRGSYFSELETSLAAMFAGDCRWADFDRDGHLDLLLTGSDGFNRLYRNNWSRSNPPPNPPFDLSTTISSHNNVTISWQLSSDMTTSNSSGLNYNLRVGRSPGGMELFAPQSDALTGERRLPHRGNAGANNRWLLANLPPGTYYWSVQAVDPGFAGSPFATEASFTITNAVDSAANHPPIVGGQAFATQEDVPVPITLMGSDPDGDPLTYNVVPPTNGVLRGIPPQLTYVPKANSFGADRFTFRARDGLTNSESATILISVAAVFDPHFISISLGSGSIQVRFNGEPGRSFAIDGSTDLSNWTELIILENTETNRTSDPNFLFYTSPGQFPQQFFRARLLP